LWQADLRNRFRAATNGNAANFNTLPANTKAAFKSEQAAIRAAVAELKLPAGEVVKSFRDTALEHLSGADSFLTATGMNADVSMDLAAKQLNSLADKIPTIGERQTRVRGEVEKLLRDQSPILVATEQAIRQTPDSAPPAALAKKLAPLVDLQKKQLAAFTALDLPGMDARRVRVIAALNAAVTDLKDALPQDLLTSQRWVKRELERVKTILVDGAVSPDDRADELARRCEDTLKMVENVVAAYPDLSGLNWSFLTQMAESLAASRATVQLQLPAAAFQDFVKLLDQFSISPEMAVLLNDAREAVQTADYSFRNQSKPQEVLRRVKLAFAAVTRLSDRLNGGESEVERIRRLAEYRRLGAAAINDKKMSNPTLAAEIVRQLGREIDELTNTRVGVSGQRLKKRLLDQYNALKDHATPERMAGMHAALAEGAEELVGMMADIDELTATFDRTPPAVAMRDADAFLPSRMLADELRAIARQYRNTRERITVLPELVVRRTQATDATPLNALEKKQRALAAELAKFADVLASHSVIFPADPGQAASDAVVAAERLHDGSLAAAKDAGERVVWGLRILANSDKAKGAADLAERQEALLKEMAPLDAMPGVSAAQQKTRAEELNRQATELVRKLEAAMRDVELGEVASKALADAAKTAKTAEKWLKDAEERANAGKPDDAAMLRSDVEASLRAAAGKTAGAGPATTTLPALDPDIAAIGGSLRQAEKAMRQAKRNLEGSDTSAAETAMRSAAESLSKAAKVVNERLTVGEGK
jgi:hypothetical protein